MSNGSVTASAPHVYVVEDNPADIRLATEGIETAGTDLELQVVTSGRRAIDRLAAIDPDSPAMHPELIFLDLNLPEKTGFDVLRSVRTETAFQNVPVVIVSSSQDSTDVRRVYEMSANAYLVKPVDPDEYIQMIETAVEFWILNATQVHNDD